MGFLAIPDFRARLFSGQTVSKHVESSYCLFLSSLLSFFSPLLVLSSSKSLFFISWGLFGSILGLQDDPPTLENRAPAEAAARFLKNRRFRSEDGLENAWGLSWARFGCSRGLLGSPFGGLGGFLGAPGGYQASFKVILELSLASFWRLRCPSS